MKGDSYGAPILFVSINQVISKPNNEFDIITHMIRNSKIKLFDMHRIVELEIPPFQVMAIGGITG